MILILYLALHNGTSLKLNPFSSLPNPKYHRMLYNICILHYSSRFNLVWSKTITTFQQTNFETFSKAQHFQNASAKSKHNRSIAISTWQLPIQDRLERFGRPRTLSVFAIHWECLRNVSSRHNSGRLGILDLGLNIHMELSVRRLCYNDRVSGRAASIKWPVLFGLHRL